MPTCGVVGCVITRSENRPKISLHRLPKNERKRQIWLDLIGLENLKSHTKSIYVCSLHFEESCFNRTLNNTILRDDAVPSRIISAQTQSSCPGRSSRKCDPEPTIETAYDDVSTYDEVDHDEVGDYKDNGSVGSDDVIDVNAEDSNSDDIEYVNKTEPTADSLIHAAFRCNVCCGEIKGFRYVCVQCTDWDMCAACEARGEHPAHYVLRLPAPKPNVETEPVLVAIREYIQGLLNLKNEAHEVYFKEEVLEEHLGEEDTESADPFSCVSDRSVPDVNINKIDSNENETDSLQAVDETVEQSAPKEPSEMCALKTDLVSYSISNKNIVITPAHIDEGSSLHIYEDSFLNMNEETDPTTVTLSEVHKPLTVQKPLGKNMKLLIKKNQVVPKKVVVPLNQSTCVKNTTEIPLHIIVKPKSESTSIPKGRLLLRQVQRPISVSSTQPDRKVIQIALSDKKITILGKRKIAPNKP